MSNFFITLDQWFSTGVPRHTRVPQEGARGATSDHIFMDIEPILTHRGSAKF